MSVHRCLIGEQKGLKKKKKNEGQLLLSFISPHKFVTAYAVARWIVEILSLPGTDTSVFKLIQQDRFDSSKARMTHLKLGLQAFLPMNSQKDNIGQKMLFFKNCIFVV